MTEVHVPVGSSEDESTLDTTLGPEELLITRACTWKQPTLQTA